MTRRSIRRACGWSLAEAAAAASVSPGTARLYEADPLHVRDTYKRRSLDRVYRALAVCIGIAPPPA